MTLAWPPPDKTELQRLGFGFLYYQAHPLAIARLFAPTPPTVSLPAYIVALSTLSHHCLATPRQNWAPAAWFQLSTPLGPPPHDCMIMCTNPTQSEFTHLNLTPVHPLPSSLDDSQGKASSGSQSSISRASAQVSPLTLIQPTNLTFTLMAGLHDPPTPLCIYSQFSNIQPWNAQCLNTQVHLSLLMQRWSNLPVLSFSNPCMYLYKINNFFIEITKVCPQTWPWGIFFDSKHLRLRRYKRMGHL